MGYLNNLTIRAKIKLLLIVAITFMVLPLAKIAFDSYDDRANNQMVLHDVHKAKLIGQLVHDAQIERGLSAGFIASHGEKNGDKLSDQRKKVDEDIKKLQDFLDEAGEDKKLLEASSELSTLRSSVSSMNIAPADAGKAYTKMIGSYLDVLVSLPATVNDSEIRNYLQAYTHLSTAKESLGQIRANLNATFTKNSFEGDSFAKLCAQKGAFDVNQKKFKQLATPKLVTFYETKVSGENVTKTMEMIDIALQKHQEGNFGVDSTTWFTNVTATIDLLKEVEDEFLAQCGEQAKSALEVANSTLLVSFISLCVMVFLLVFIGLFITKTITQSINGIKEGIEVLYKSNDTNYRLQLASQDEMQDIAVLFNQYIDKLANIAKADQLVVDEIGRVAKQIGYGFVSVRVKAQAGTPALQQTVNELNYALNSMEQGFQTLLEILSKFAANDYTAHIETGKYGGELGGAITGLRAIIEISSDFIALIAKNGSAMNSGAITLTEASGDLSHSSNTQASNLEETAAAIEELTSNISANSQKATQMATLAQEAQKAANDGKTLADSTVIMMNEISSATQAINAAVDIIENIAFQTNILSLNAAVEAATAGEAGKGFAVVAQEVRNLAGRSAEAAKQIKELTELANQKSSDGLSVTQDMMKGFDAINQKISQTTELVQDVANGSREQMAGINQINMAITQLDQMTQQNAGSAHKVDKLADEILGMSQMLMEIAAKTKYLKDSEQRICRIDMMFETNKLKFDHVNFKNNNFAKLKDSISGWTVVNETQCDLGKWIVAHSNEPYANGGEWNNLLRHHEHVHQKTQEYINREKAGAHPEELNRLAKEIEEDTTHVFAGLNQIRTRACAQEQQDHMPTAPQQQTRMAPPRHVAKPALKGSSPSHQDDNWDSF
ncbi:MAG: nitrate- and nitrite sensing domain-containing protein [Thiotrichales bacterium]|nr:nitrate- and nitrite sensing domain-containing protein [Thiotrichales bacterium]